MASSCEESPRPQCFALGTQRDLFDVPEEIAYFNTANMSPLLVSVRGAGESGLARRATPWNISAPDWFTDVERLRSSFATLVGSDADAIGLVPSTSYGLAVAARNVRARDGDRVIVLAEEYPSNFYTWRQFCERTGAELDIVEREEGHGWTKSVLGRIDERTRIVAVPHVHWTNGAILDLDAIARASRSVQAALVIDASQSLGAVPLAVRALQPDFVVAVGYKWLLGPLGLGYLYVAEQYRDGEPLEENWINRAGSGDFAGLVDYTDDYAAGARRFDVGHHSNFGLVPMAVAALDQLLAWGVDAVANSLRVVTDQMAKRVALLGLNVPESNLHGPHLLGIDFPQDVGLRLGTQLAELGVIASVRGNSLRLAPHLHVTSQDIDRLVTGLSDSL